MLLGTFSAATTLALCRSNVIYVVGRLGDIFFYVTLTGQKCFYVTKKKNAIIEDMQKEASERKANH